MEQAEKDKIHAASIAKARERLEQLMSTANLSVVARERLRSAFANTTSMAGMKQAVNVEKQLMR